MKEITDTRLLQLIEECEDINEVIDDVLLDQFWFPISDWDQMMSFSFKGIKYKFKLTEGETRRYDGNLITFPKMAEITEIS